MLLSSINTYLYNKIFSEETLRYPAAYYCPSALKHTYTDTVRRKTKISSSMLLSPINTCLYNMILSEETLRYLVVCYCPPLIHTFTI